MMNSVFSALKKATLLLAAAGCLAGAAPTPAAAGGLSDLLAGLSVQSGCSQFMGPYGYPVPVKYYLPGNSGCAAPAVVLLHGIDGGSRYEGEYEQIGKGLAAKGYAAFIVYYFEGLPTVPRPGPYDRSLAHPEAFASWVNTAKAGVSYAQSFPGINPARVAIMGMSLGGFVGTSAAANNPQVRALVVLSGGMPDMYAKNARQMPPTLIVHGQQDRDVPVWEAYKLHDMMARRGLWNDLDIMPCEAHLPYRNSRDAVAARVLRFFDSAL